MDDTPNIRELYEMILTLSDKNNKLEKKLEELTAISGIKKKLPVKEWLDQHYADTNTYDTFLNSLVITTKHYNYVTEYDYIEGIIMVIKEIMPIADDTIFPIKSFDKKNNTFFIKRSDGWGVMLNDELGRLIVTIEKKIMGHFVSWQQSNIHKIHSDRYSEEYTATLQKVIGGNFKKDAAYIKIRKFLFKYVNINMKNIIPFEFV